MAQYARPSADISAGSWSNQAGATSGLFAALDEDVADETDFAQSSLTANDAMEVRLSTPPVPLIDRGHVLRYRCRKNQAAGNVRGVTVELRQGATVLASNTHADLTALWQPDNAFLLTTAQAAAITTYADLRVRFTATGTVSGTASVRRRVQVAWARLRVPDSTFGALAISEGPTVWSYTLDGQTGTGPSREDALVDLFTKLRDANPADAIRQRRWTFVYYARKIRDYTAMRAQIAALAAGAAWITGQTKADALAVCDAKLTTFDTLTNQADTEDGG